MYAPIYNISYLACLRYLFSARNAYEELPCGSQGKESACNVGDLDLIPGFGRSPGEGNGNPLQYSCLDNSMNRGAWQATVYGVSRSWTQMSNL